MIAKLVFTLNGCSLLFIHFKWWYLSIVLHVFLFRDYCVFLNPTSCRSDGGNLKNSYKEENMYIVNNRQICYIANCDAPSWNISKLLKYFKECKLTKPDWENGLLTTLDLFKATQAYPGSIKLILKYLESWIFLIFSN